MLSLSLQRANTLFLLLQSSACWCWVCIVKLSCCAVLGSLQWLYATVRFAWSSLWRDLAQWVGFLHQCVSLDVVVHMQHVHAQSMPRVAIWQLCQVLAAECSNVA